MGQSGMSARIYDLIPSFVGLAIIAFQITDFVIQGGLESAIGYNLAGNISGWLMLVSPYLVIVASYVLVRTYVRNVVARSPKWQFSVLMLIACACYVVVGLTLGPEQETYQFVYAAVAQSVYLSVYGISGVSLALGLATAYQVRSFTKLSMLILTIIAIGSFTVIGEMIGPWWADLSSAFARFLRESVWSFGYAGGVIEPILFVAILVRVATLKEKLRAFGGE